MLVMIGLSGAASSFADGYVESEKVYVTTDRHVYTPGERLSFSVFVVDEGHKVQKESAMVKVLLVDGKEQAIDSVVAHVLNGRFSYFFMLPKNGGIYRIKASTRWQLNELKPQQFQKEIFVQQVIQKKFFIAQSFTKTNYIQGDSITTRIRFTKRGDEPIAGANFSATLLVDGQPESTVYDVANNVGKATITMVLPQRNFKSAYVKISSNYQGNSEYVTGRIPIQNGKMNMVAHTESGLEYLVAGMKNRLVIESFDSKGNPKDISGYIETADGKRIKGFTSFHKGMAEIIFTPKPNTQYVIVSASAESKVFLPKVQSNKPYLKVYSRSGNLIMESTSTQADVIQVSVSGNGKVFLNKTITPQPNQMTSKVQISQSSLPAGVYGIQFKTKEGEILGRRLFINRPNSIDVTIETNKDQVSLGQEVTVKINTNKEKASFAIRAISEQVYKQMKDRSHSIVSWMYLGSEILSEIEKPTFYFDESESNSYKALEALGIVKRNAWRRDYETGMVIKKKGDLYERRAAYLGGTVYKYYPHLPNLKGIKVRIKNTSYVTETDSLGRFKFSGLPGHIIANSPVLIVSKGTERMEYPVHNGYNYYNHEFSESVNNSALGTSDAVLRKMLIPESIKTILKYKLLGQRYVPGIVDVERSVMASSRVSSNYSIDAMRISPMQETLSQILVYTWDFGEVDGNYTLMQDQTWGYAQPFGVSLTYRSNPNYKSYPGPIRLSNNTTYWYGEAKSGENGEAVLKFYAPIKNDGVIIFCEGVTASGKIFVCSTSIKVQDEIEVFSNIPTNLTVGDFADVNLEFINHGRQQQTVTYTTYLNGENETNSISLEGGTSKNVVFNLTTSPSIKEIQFQYTYQFQSIQRNSAQHVIPVLVKGHHREQVLGGTETSKAVDFEVNNVIPGTAQIQLSVLNDFVDMLEVTSKRMIRQPGGCFEQVSSSNYPNLLALKVLQQNARYVATDLIGKIQSGYARLAAYETPSNGFEWYGRNPPHTTLSAYGLLQFSLTRELGLTIDEKMFNRNLDWLLSRRDDKGGFQFHRGKYGFSSSNYQTNNAYVTWVLSRLKKTGIKSEIEAIERDVENEFDAYKLALLAGIYANTGNTDAARNTLKKLQTHFKKHEYAGFKTAGSIMYSGGRSIDVEIMALTLLAANAVNKKPEVFENTLIDQIMGSQNGYGFGNTQATALALEALSNYLGYFQSKDKNQSYTVWLDGKMILELATSDSKQRHKSLMVAEGLLKTGKHTVQVKCGLAKQLPFSFEFKWLEQVDKVEHPELVLDYTFSKNEITQSDEIFASIELTNRTNQDKPQTVAVIKIPSGLSFSMEELRYLKKEGLYDYFESSKDELVFYFLGLEANATKTIPLSLKPVINGRFAPAESYVYQYYTPEIRSSVLAEPVRIRPEIKQ
mgnify:FL=1